MEELIKIINITPRQKKVLDLYQASSIVTNDVSCYFSLFQEVNSLMGFMGEENTSIILKEHFKEKYEDAMKKFRHFQVMAIQINAIYTSLTIRNVSQMELNDDKLRLYLKYSGACSLMYPIILEILTSLYERTSIKHIPIDVNTFNQIRPDRKMIYTELYKRPEQEPMLFKDRLREEDEDERNF